MSFSFDNISDLVNVSANRLREEKTKEIILFFLLCVAINLIGGIDIASRKMLYLDMLGTALAGIALGPWWGASVGLVTNLLLYLFLPTSPSLLVFAIVNIFGGLYWGYMCNLRVLRPLEGVTSFLKVFTLSGFFKSLWFVIISGGLALSIPSFFILRNVLGFIKPDTDINRYLYYLTINVSDKLLCVIIATIIICSFFPALGGHLVSERIQKNYGVTNRSVVWFSLIYLVPFIVFIYSYPTHWVIWSIPYLIAFVAYLFQSEGQHLSGRINVHLPSVIYGGLFWIVSISVAVFFEYIYFALQHVNSRFDVYFTDNTVNFKNILADATSLSIVVLLIGVVFTILIQAIKHKEDKEILRRVDIARDRIATDIHNDPLQLISVLRRKISTVESLLSRSKELINNLNADNSKKNEFMELEKQINELNKIFNNYYAPYLPELDTSIRRIIKPLSNQDSYGIEKIGFLNKFKGLMDEFTERNRNITLVKTVNLTESQLPQARSDGEIWKIELLKVIREILNNIEKHSQADKVSIEIKTTMFKGKKRLFVSIRDNGIGFNPKYDSFNPESFGLYEIKTRSKDIGANVSINYASSAEEKKGTVVILEIPFDY